MVTLRRAFAAGLLGLAVGRVTVLFWTSLLQLPSGTQQRTMRSVSCSSAPTGNQTFLSNLDSCADLLAYRDESTPSNELSSNDDKLSNDTKAPTPGTTRQPTAFRFCGIPTLHFPSPFQGRNRSTVIPVDYQCQGAAYDNFTDQLVAYAHQRHTAKGNEHWGRRTFPFPNGTSILAMGNSHTKQAVFTLLCQYADEIESVQSLGPPDIEPPLIAFFLEVVFTNNVSLVFSGNHPLVYSNTWFDHFQRCDPRHRALDDFDALILGQFNDYDPKIGRNSIFQWLVLNFQKSHPDLDLDFETNPGPRLDAVARRFPKPIVVLPMFAKYTHWFEEQALQTARAWSKRPNDSETRMGVPSGNRSAAAVPDFPGSSMPQRTNIAVIPARRHMEVLGTECGSALRTEVGACHHNPGMHRCTGPRGGDADLVAWDLVEAVGGLLFPDGFAAADADRSTR